MSSLPAHLFLVALLQLTVCVHFSHGLSCYHCVIQKVGGVEVRAGGRRSGSYNGTDKDTMEKFAGQGQGREGGPVKCAGDPSTWRTDDDCKTVCYTDHITFTMDDEGKDGEIFGRGCAVSSRTEKCRDTTRIAKDAYDGSGWTNIKSQDCYCSQDKCNDYHPGFRPKKETPDNVDGVDGNGTDHDGHGGAAGLDGKLGWIIIVLGLGGVLIGNLGLIGGGGRL